MIRGIKEKKKNKKKLNRVLSSFHQTTWIPIVISLLYVNNFVVFLDYTI